MRITCSVIKADIGSIGGHICPSPGVIAKVRAVVQEKSAALLRDFNISHTGDDIAIFMTHTKGVGCAEIHELAWNAFVAGTEVARSEGLYGAGQDLLKDAFSGNVTGAGPAVAEFEFEERKAEPLLFFAADKTDPGAYNLPLYLAFADPMNTPGLILAPGLGKGFKWTVMDVEHTGGDKVIELVTPEEIYPLAALLRDTERFVIESIVSRANGDQAAVVSTSRLHNIAGKYVGKDDPVMFVRAQMAFPATGEILAPFQVGSFVAGGMRGSHNMPLMPVKLNSTVSHFDGPPVVSCAAMSMRGGKITGPVDAFDHPFWDHVRNNISAKAIEMRKQGFFGPAMLPWTELEYTGIKETLEALDKKFKVRG